MFGFSCSDRVTLGLVIYKRECQEEPSGNTPKSICAHNQTNKETTKYKNVFIFIFIANKYETKMVQVVIFASFV